MAEFGKWVEIKTRPLTEEEKQECGDEAEWYEFMYDCELPDDGQEVLVQLHYGIELTTFYTDMGCYFENYEDEDDVLAWMPLPKEFVKEQNNVNLEMGYKKGREEAIDECINTLKDFCGGLPNNNLINALEQLKEQNK